MPSPGVRENGTVGYVACRHAALCCARLLSRPTYHESWREAAGPQGMRVCHGRLCHGGPRYLKYHILYYCAVLFLDARDRASRRARGTSSTEGTLRVRTVHGRNRGVRNAPPGGGIDTRHTAVVIEDTYDTIPPSPQTYSHHRSHIHTIFFHTTPHPHNSSHEWHGRTHPAPLPASA